jgi:hypothetical protein
LGDPVSFSVWAKIPDFLVGNRIVYWVRLGGENGKMASEKVETVLDSSLQFEVHLESSVAGRFTKLDLCFGVSGLTLVAVSDLPTTLVVVEETITPTYDVKLPFFLSPGATQAATFIADHLGSPISSITFSFAMTGLKEVRRRFENSLEASGPDSPVRFDRIEQTIELTLVYEYTPSADEVINVTIEITEKGGQVSSFVEKFGLPRSEAIDILHLHETDRNQQFEIVNPHPTDFNFTFKNKTLVLPALSNVTVLRPFSTEPLSLRFAESGWEEFPVELITSTLQDRDYRAVRLAFEQLEWTDGVPQAATADPPSSPLLDADSRRDWIITPLGMTGESHLFVPKHPGLLKIPMFQVGGRACATVPNFANVRPADYPPFVLL